ncbi:MAG: Mut7-C RNAse domain-containing protein [Spirochaetota bacterium]
MNHATIRLYQELINFLAPGETPPGELRGEVRKSFIGNPAVKDLIESLGVPHTEVDLVVVNGDSVGFDYPVHDGDRIAVYPVFESFDVSPVSRVRNTPLRRTRFILDVHLGKLARVLRMLGFDALYDNCWDDPEIVGRGIEEHRIILTRDHGILKRREVSHGYLVRSDDPIEQAAEVVRRFDLAGDIRPFERCTACNGTIEPVAKNTVEHELLPGTRESFSEFFRCSGCGRIYWKGTHYDKMLEKIEAVLARSGNGRGSRASRRAGPKDRSQ